jgi:hypothetical protein
VGFARGTLGPESPREAEPSLEEASRLRARSLGQALDHQPAGGEAPLTRRSPWIGNTANNNAIVWGISSASDCTLTGNTTNGNGVPARFREWWLLTVTRRRTPLKN